MCIKLVILDRDGVINHESPGHIRSPGAWIPLPGSLEAIAAFKQAGIHVAVATNQSGIARGYYTPEILAAIHTKMLDAVRKKGGNLELIEYCPHDRGDGCNCRKPAPGLLIRIMDRLAISPSHTLMVGDSIRDLEAAEAAHCYKALVKTGYGNRELTTSTWNKQYKKNTPVFDNLADLMARYPF